MSEADRPVCGNCGKPVAATDLSCPQCGVLLTAHRAVSSAAEDDARATGPVTGSAWTTPDYAKPPKKPISPIDEAMRQGHTASAPAVTSDAAAAELSRMATSDTDFAQEVTDELRDLVVVIDEQAGATIETAPGNADVAINSPPEAESTVSPVAEQLKQAPPEESISREAQLPPPEKAATPSKAPIILIVVIVIFGIAAFRNPAALTFLIIAGVLAFIFFKVVISVSKSNGRTTTRMPRDQPQQQQRNRRH